MRWLILGVACDAAFLGSAFLRAPRARASTAQALAGADEEVDYVVVGSGYGGLSCAGLLASQGYKVAVLEQHYEIGGCAHEFNVNLEGRTIPSDLLERKPEPVFKFEAGPSLCSAEPHMRCSNPSACSARWIRSIHWTARAAGTRASRRTRRPTRSSTSSR